MGPLKPQTGLEWGTELAGILKSAVEDRGYPLPAAAFENIGDRGQHGATPLE